MLFAHPTTDLLFMRHPLPMWVFDRATLQILDVNDAALQQYGYSRAEFLGMKIADLRPPEDVPLLMTRLAAADAGWQRSGIWRHRTRAGDILHVEITSNRLEIEGRTLVTIAALDVTHLVESEARLRAANTQLEASERRYRELVENLNEIIWSTDLQGTITFVSGNAGNYGYSVDQLIGENMITIVHPDDAPEMLEARRAALRGESSRCEFRAIDGTGSVHHVRSSYRVLYEDERPVGFTGVLSDITEQRKAEEQLRVSQRLEAVGRLAGGIAHDFNNLLVVINGYAEMLLDRLPQDDPSREELAEILRAGDRAASLTQQLLAFSRKQFLRPSLSNLNDVVRGMASMLRRVIGEDVRFETELAAEVPSIFIDAPQLEHAMMNLVVNARDAMPSGGTLRITTAVETAPADGPAGPGCVVLMVEDTGHGMDEATKARIFEPFFTTKPVGQGTGLGLPMVYGFIQQSGGTVDVQSEPERGSRVILRFPADDAAALDAPGERLRIQHGTERILLVEDEDVVRQLVARVLTMVGYRLETAASAAEALPILEDPENPLDLLLTDLVMPVMSGAELAERAAVIRPGLRVLFMSGYPENPAAGSPLPPNAHSIGKPFTAAQLTTAIRGALADG